MKKGFGFRLENYITTICSKECLLSYLSDNIGKCGEVLISEEEEKEEE